MACRKARGVSFKDYKPASSRSSELARRIRSVNTEPELLLRRALWRMGLRYRVSPSDLPGRPDIVLCSQRVAIFCDGDFWHGRNWQGRARALKKGSNAGYWVEKIHANRLRDRRTNHKLRSRGWAVVRLWETDIKADIDGAVNRILQILKKSEREIRKL